MNTTHPADDAIIAHALDELESRDRETLDAHLEGCAACRQVAGRVRAALDAYRSAEPLEAPARVLADLLEAQAARRERRAGWSWRLRPVFVTAGLIVLAGIFASGFWFGRSSAPGAGAPAASVEAAGDAAPVPRQLPERPVIEFRAEPPLMTRFAMVAETGPPSARPARHDGRDSL